MHLMHLRRLATALCLDDRGAVRGDKTATGTESDIPSGRDATLSSQAGPELAAWPLGIDSVPAR